MQGLRALTFAALFLSGFSENGFFVPLWVLHLRLRFVSWMGPEWLSRPAIPDMGFRASRRGVSKWSQGFKEAGR